MYSVVRTGGFQHKVSPGEILKVSKLEEEVGQVVTLGDVLLVGEGEEIKIGSPMVEGASVKAQILAHRKDDKVLIYKMKRRKGYRRKQGHRQWYTEVVVTEISEGEKSVAADKKLIDRALLRAKALERK